MAAGVVLDEIGELLCFNGRTGGTTGPGTEPFKGTAPAPGGGENAEGF